MSKVTFEVVESGASLLTTALIDGAAMKRESPTKFTKTVPDNRKHGLQWFVRGPKGTEYRVAITSPEDIVWKSRKKTVDPDDGTDAGLRWFKVERPTDG